MAYNKKTWMSNETITKEALNNIENGIAALSKTFDTVADLKSANVQAGDIVYTLGYYKKGDGGGYVYEIVNNPSLDTEVVNIQLDNGLKAKYGLNLNLYDINVLTVGIRKNDSSAEEQNSFIMEKILVKYNKVCKLYFPGGEYFISNIHFTREPIPKEDILMNLYGEYASSSDTSKGANKTKINTRNKDFICDRRPCLDTPIIRSLKLCMKDMTIQSTSYIENIPPNGVCLGMPKEVAGSNNEINFNFENVSIIGFDFGVRSPVWSCGGSGGYNINFSNCHCGIYVGLAMHCFDAERISFNDCVLGVDTGWGGCNAKFKNIHISTGYLGVDRENYNEYVGILSRGNVTLDAIYYEPYNDNGFMDRCVVIKHEGYAYGIGPLYIKNTGINYPGSGNVGLFLKSNCYLGFGPSRGAESPIKLCSWDQGHFPDGVVVFENCSVPTYINTLKDIIEINKDYYGATHDYKYHNIWWGYDFDGLNLHAPDLLISRYPCLRGRGYLYRQAGELLNKFKEIHAETLSEVDSLYDPVEINSAFRRNILCAGFPAKNPYNRFTYEYDISMSIDGTFSSDVDVTIGLFARTDFDNSTLRLVKKIKVIKGGETYNDFERSITYTINPIIDYLPTENRMYFGVLSNTGSVDNALTFADRELIQFDYTVKQIPFRGYSK